MRNFKDIVLYEDKYIWHTIKPGTRNYRTPEHWRNIQPNTGRTIEIPQNSGT